ncbi:Hsp20/alpha crystallin family protein [Duganella sp. BJB488]|uniref:Hsp20/alpha crystallin family protein n=1 Tax=unclassified Duganella TaxID=2636909 RepID=UPI000E34A112|nr:MULTISPECIES: Hsp20/alpha crystallin family protein [unclassified Duganella]RFP21617.1 Hsp20/alpha crystallin family protein [Duganella sp. BJB489]RFP23410.1 Hsp20/alpha crystallin family protein [Duganella sp. BJB488]RFP38576.1 Hsp20/alpha crystallin family protein [Duganella sp. BJB480]
MANNLTQFDPFGDLARLEPLRGVEDFFRDFRLKNMLRDFDAKPSIKLDVVETEQGYSVKAELPGMKKEDIKVDVDGNRVTISAETKRESEQKEGKTVVRSERYVGQLYRSFTLEKDVDDGKAEAKYQDGVLELTLPKKPNNGAKKLVIS